MSKREGTDASVEGRQNILVHGVAAVVVEATSLQVDMVHGKGDDAESGASRRRCQAATRQDETNETNIDEPSEDVENSNGAVVGSVTSWHSTQKCHTTVVGYVRRRQKKTR